MRGPLFTSDKKTVWYENDAPVNEYLDNENFRKTDDDDKKTTSDKVSWSDIIKKSLPVK